MSDLEWPKKKVRIEFGSMIPTKQVWGTPIGPGLLRAGHFINRRALVIRDKREIATRKVITSQLT